MLQGRVNVLPLSNILRPFEGVDHIRCSNSAIASCRSWNRGKSKLKHAYRSTSSKDSYHTSVMRLRYTYHTWQWSYSSRYNYRRYNNPVHSRICRLWSNWFELALVFRLDLCV